MTARKVLLLALAATLAMAPCPAAQKTADEPDIEQIHAAALRFYGRGELDQATELLQAALARFPQAGRLHYLRALTYRDSMPSRPDEAAAELTLALRLAPELPDAARILADILVRAGRGKEARQMLHQRVLAYPDDIGALWTLGTLLLSDHRHDEGFALLQRAVESAPNDFRTWLALGQGRVRGGEMEQALRPLERARLLAPRSASVRYTLARALRASGQEAAAQQELEAYQELHSQRWIKQEEMQRQDRLHRAITLHEASVREQPGGAITRYGDLALLYEEGDTVDHGRQFLAGVATAHPDLVEPLVGQALLEHAAGDDDRALEHLGTALSRQPLCAPALGLLPELDPGNGRLQRAAALLKAADRQEGAPQQLAFWRGLLALRGKQMEEAEFQLHRALEKTPTDADVLLNLGALYGQLGRLEQARSTFQALVKQRPEDGQAWYNLAFTEAQLDLPRQAVEHLGNARAAGEEHPLVWNLLAQLLMSQGNLEQAAELLEQSLTAEPGQSAVRQALEKLRQEATP